MAGGQARLVCVLPKGHRLAAFRAVHARDLDQLSLISFSGTLAIGAALESAFVEVGATRHIGVEVGQTFLACALVAAGAGVAVVDKLVVGNLPKSVVVRPFEPARIVRLYALARPERPSLAAQALLNTVATAARTRSAPRVARK